jgi:hypothetical protein
VLGVLKDGSGLGLYDAKGKTRGGLGVDDHGPTVELFDEKGNIIWQAPPPDDAPEEAEGEGE